ncbi:hypothetical protein J2I47_23995 [Fibrella sp. HMF5335]|uniref:Uncharacterized protein n=1 Tax=Fibrella rubiginis TaxID=2817060 RepID=A0A939GNE2_9BACT|nr:hypothetical protein [Fibrella rubiginis]MBO0939633.1 hypothetical protein [Fibrella rubiginis]
MKVALIRFLHVFMAVVVLLSSMGFGLVDHTCQMRGKRTYLIHEHGKACKMCSAHVSEQESGPVVKRSACCQETVRYEKVDVGSSLGHVLIKFVKAVSEVFDASVAAMFTALFGLFFLHPATHYAAAPDPPAPPAGRDLLVLVQSFLI